MFFLIFLWLLVWGGMFTGLYNVQAPEFLSNPFSFFQGIRAFFPILAAYLCLIWIWAVRPKFPFIRNPLGFLFAYSFLGIITSLFLSLNRWESLYWAGVYISPLFVIWVALEYNDFKGSICNILHLNYAIFFLITMSLFPETIRIFLGRASSSAFYHLPFNLGEITKNGAGRYALVVIIVSSMRLIAETRKQRVLWIAPLLPSLLLLTQTQSRTSLLGLAVAAVLFVLLKGINWRFLFVGPVAAYVVWISGVKWRAHGQLENLLSLTGREYTWQRGLEQIKHSPFLGWGFNADRIMLRFEHMHNSYLQALMQGGLVGTIFFLAAFIGIWFLIFRANLFRLSRKLQGREQALLIESVLIVGFLTARSFFESTAAFYGVDLLLLIPAMAYISLVAQASMEENPEFQEDQPEET